MYPCGHVGFGLLFCVILKNTLNLPDEYTSSVEIITMIASILPDLIDKPLYLLKIQNIH